MLRDKLRRPPRQSTRPVIEMRARERARSAQSSGGVAAFRYPQPNRPAVPSRCIFPPYVPIARYKCRDAPPGTARRSPRPKFYPATLLLSEVVSSPSRDAFVPRNVNATCSCNSRLSFSLSATRERERERERVLSDRSLFVSRISTRATFTPLLFIAAALPDNASFDHDDFATATRANDGMTKQALGKKRERERERERDREKERVLHRQEIPISLRARARFFLRALGPFRPVSSRWVAPCNFNRP